MLPRVVRQVLSGEVLVDGMPLRSARSSEETRGKSRLWEDGKTLAPNRLKQPLFMQIWQKKLQRHLAAKWSFARFIKIIFRHFG